MALGGREGQVPPSQVFAEYFLDKWIQAPLPAGLR